MFPIGTGTTARADEFQTELITPSQLTFRNLENGLHFPEALETDFEVPLNELAFEDMSSTLLDFDFNFATNIESKGSHGSTGLNEPSAYFILPLIPATKCSRIQQPT